VGLPFWFIVGLFGLKVAYGCINLYFHNTEYISNDAHYLFLESMKMLNDFPNRPGYYLGDWIFNWSEITTHLNLLNSNNSPYWSDLGRLVHQRFMVLCTIFSFGHEYVNVVIYNSFFFIGCLALLKSFTHFKPNQKLIFTIIIFCIPSIAFWCSGIHKDGFILSVIGLVCWFSIKVFQRAAVRNILLLTVSLLLLMSIRYFYFLVFLPLFITYLLTRHTRKPFYLFAGLVSLGIVVFLFVGQVLPDFNLMQLVVNRQQEFLSSKGYSDLQSPILEANYTSFIKHLPTALEHIFIEPIPQMGHRFKYDITAFDSIFSIGILGFALFKLKRTNFSNSFFWFLLFFGLLCLVFIGYTIPNLGALVRYESPFICLLLLSLYALGDFRINKLSLE
jgi:hypothetical protein